MATTRPFAYNTGSPIAGTTQVGQIAVGTPTSGFVSTGLQWWNGPDEELGYVIAKTFSTQPTPIFTNNPLTLSTTYKPVDILLSNGNKTAYVSQWAYTQTVLSDTLIDRKDKIMFSLTFSSTSPGVMFGAYIGVGTRSMNYSGAFGSFPGTDNQSVGFAQDGTYYYNGAVQATGLPTWISGSTIDIAIDLESGNKIWIRVGGGNWNNDPGQSPESGVCSLGMGGLNKIYPALCPGSAAGSSYGSMTLLDTPQYDVPSGFQFLGTNLYDNIKFIRSSALTDQSFVNLVNSKFGQNFSTGTNAKTWLDNNNYWTSWVDNTPPSQSGFSITVTNNGSNVLMIGTGSVNLTDLSLVATNQGPVSMGGIGINSATFISGANGQNYDEYSGFLTVPSNFGSGSGLPPSSVSGSLFGIIYQGAPPHHLMVPTGYTSGTQITTSQTFNNTSIASLGLTVGTYTYTWGTGPNADSVTVVIA